MQMELCDCHCDRGSSTHEAHSDIETCRDRYCLHMPKPDLTVAHAHSGPSIGPMLEHRSSEKSPCTSGGASP